MTEKYETKIDFKSIYKFVENNYLKNRTLVTKDISGIFDELEQLLELPLIRYKYHTGEDHGTWVIPPQWDIKKAWLKDDKGKVIASYDDHPLFISPYSKPIHLKLDREELLRHTVSQPLQPDAYSFNWRYAADARLQLKDWGISLPQNLINSLEDCTYELLIDAEISDGDMLVGEVVLPGKSEETILFIADYCHPGQVNDSFSGLVMFCEVMNILSRIQKTTQFTYKLLIVHETVGSAVYIASDPSRMKNVKGAIFSEMVGWGDKWFIKNTNSGKSYMDLLAKESVRAFEDLSTSEFGSLVGNDEYILDSVQVGIPTLSLQKYPFEEYHTSNDRVELLQERDLQHAVDIICHMVDVLENDIVLEQLNPVPFWMTRFDLYADDQYEEEQFLRNLKIVYNYLDGENSILEIADLVDVPFHEVFKYLMKMSENNLVSIKI